MKKCFTLVEVLFASGICSFVMIIGISVIYFINAGLYDGQVESTNRKSLNDTIFYITREIQSAESICITDSGKTIKIKQQGEHDFSLVYEIKDNYPVAFFAFRESRLFDLDYESSFRLEDRQIILNLNVVADNVSNKNRSFKFNLAVTPRNDNCIVWEE